MPQPQQKPIPEGPEAKPHPARIEIPEELHSALGIVAAMEGISIKKVVARTFREYFRLFGPRDLDLGESYDAAVKRTVIEQYAGKVGIAGADLRRLVELVEIVTEAPGTITSRKEASETLALLQAAEAHVKEKLKSL